jgi:hypothetical protein
MAGYPRHARLLREADFDLGVQLARGGRGGRGNEARERPAVARAAATERWVFRRAGRWLALTAWRRQEAEATPIPRDPPVSRATSSWQVFLPLAGPVRFGYTIGKRNARRAVDRNLIKRVLRESARAARTSLEAGVLAHNASCGAAPADGVDLVFRLKAPLGESAAARPAKGSRARRAGAAKGPAVESGTKRASVPVARPGLPSRSPQLRLALRGEADALLVALHAALSPTAGTAGRPR